MAEFDFTLTAAPILGGADLAIGQNQVRERSDLAIVSIATPLGGDDDLAKALEAGWALGPPTPTISTQSGDFRALRTASDQLLLVFPHTQPDAERQVAKKLNGAGYTTDQTDSWIVLEIAGPDTLSAFERLCPLDVSSMPKNGTARTVMEHMGAILLRLADDRFLLLSASSSARSFLHAVETSYKNVVVS